jgi:hypothetical protein
VHYYKGDRLSPKQSEAELKIMVQVANETKPQTLGQLVAALKEKMPNYTEEDIVEAVQQLQAEGKITFDGSAQHVPNGMGLYPKSRQALWYWITLATSILSTVAVFVLPEQFYPWAFVRQILGTLLVLWFPGYALTKALLLTQTLFSSWSKTEKAIMQICLSLCLSLAIASLLTLLLNYTSWGIRSDSVTLSLLGFTVLASTVSLVRENRAKS